MTVWFAKKYLLQNWEKKKIWNYEGSCVFTIAIDIGNLENNLNYVTKFLPLKQQKTNHILVIYLTLYERSPVENGEAFFSPAEAYLG